MSIIAFTLETKINFLFEKWSETYMRYVEVNLAKEKLILVQEHIWSSWSIQLAERCGAKL